MNLIIVPPAFSLLFWLPILTFSFLLWKGKDVSISIFVYIIFQIGLCALARHIYG